MSGAMVSWIRKKVLPTSSTRDAASLKPETLLEKRFTTLTPSSSQESLVVDPQLSSRFFTALSAELRIAILTAAFGNRTMHINYHQKKSSPTKSDAKFSRWRKKSPEPKTEPAKLFGSTCRRMRFLDDGHGPYDPGIFKDRCLTLSMTDDSWPEEFLATIRVGAIGWLLSCRQAYIEGIDILYSTNTFHIPSPHLSAHLPSFILPQRLSRIRKVELAWEWGMFQPQRDEDTFERQLAYILSKPPVELPRLTSLKIAFQDNPWSYACMHTSPSRGEFAPWLEEKVLVPLDGLVKALPALEECEAFFTASIHWFLGREAAVEEDERGRLWRGGGGDGERERGYWVCVGRDDTPRAVCGLAFN